MLSNATQTGTETHSSKLTTYKTQLLHLQKWIKIVNWNNLEIAMAKNLQFQNEQIRISNILHQKKRKKKILMITNKTLSNSDRQTITAVFIPNQTK